jgi:hypothetical protein
MSARQVRAAPTASQRKMLENIAAGRAAHHGFLGARSASAILGTILERGWLQHTLETTGPAFFLTDAGRQALETRS